jgi:hypothetical protein
MKFHRDISIIFGVIASFVLYLIAVLYFGAFDEVGAAISTYPGSSWFGVFLLILSYIVGGFIATYFAKEKKIKYGLYEGLILILVYFIWTIPIWYLQYSNANAPNTIFANLMILLLAITGGMLAKMTDKNYEGFNPILTVISGSAIGFSCMEILVLITGHHPGSYTLDMIGVAVGVISFLIAGFITSFLSKEKNILDGLCTGVIIILFCLLQEALLGTTVIIHVSTTVLYIISAVIGSYLAIIAAKHQKLISNG